MNGTTPQAILSRLKTAREKADIRQDIAAARLGIGQSMFCRIESGERALTVEQLIKLSELYGVSYLWAMTGETYDVDTERLKTAVKFALENLDYAKKLLGGAKP